MIANELHAGTPVEEHKFIPENPSSAPSNVTKPRTQEQKENMKALKADGGVCVFCRARKKQCNSPRPCGECTRTNRPCLRDFSLCLAKPARNHAQFQLRDGIFQEAKETLEDFQKEHNFDLLVGNKTVFVNWKPHNEYNPIPWSKGLDQLKLDEINVDVRNSLVDLALKGISIPQLEQTRHFEPRYNDLYKDAHVMFKLLAAMETISRSELTIEPEHALKTARFIIYLMLTVYAMKISEVSMFFVARLQVAIENNPLGGYKVWWAVEIYSQLLKRLESFQKPESYLSNLFHQIQLRLNKIQTRVNKVLSTIPQEQRIVLPSISEAQPSRIAIRITPERNHMLLPVNPRLDMNPDGVSCGVDKLLCQDFNLDMICSDTNVARTVDPKALTRPGPAPRFEFPSTHASTTDAAIGIFSAPDGYQETDATFMHLQDLFLPAYLDINTINDLGGYQEIDATGATSMNWEDPILSASLEDSILDVDQDLKYLGDHLS